MEDAKEVKKRILEYLKNLKSSPYNNAPNSTTLPVREEVPNDDGLFINRWADEYAKVAKDKEIVQQKKDEELKKKQELHKLRRKITLERSGFDIGEFEED